MITTRFFLCISLLLGTVYANHDGKLRGSKHEEVHKHRQDDDAELWARVLAGDQSVEEGSTGRRLQCKITYGGLYEEMNKQTRELSSIGFKTCINQQFKRVEGDFHADIVTQTWQEALSDTDNRRNLVQDDGSVHRLLGRAVQGGLDMWWGCTWCKEEGPLSDSWRRKLELSQSNRNLELSDLGITAGDMTHHEDMVKAFKKSWKMPY
mmetsp:Transcript_15708/g.23925  ORF Transcript_15708/g.23925 Transcript_15708/m.23925 type:complete len:208 (-) Transcript_15708:288-911(-)